MASSEEGRRHWGWYGHALRQDDSSKWMKNVWILWLKVLGLKVDQREHDTKYVTGDMKSLKLSKEYAWVRIEVLMIAGVNVSDCFW